MKRLISLIAIICVALSFAFAADLVPPEGYTTYQLWYDGSLIIDDGKSNYFYFNGLEKFPIEIDEQTGATAFYDAEKDVYIPLQRYSTENAESKFNLAESELLVPYESIRVSVDGLGLTNYSTDLIIPEAFTGILEPEILRKVEDIEIDSKNPKFAMIGRYALYDKIAKTLVFYGFERFSSKYFGTVETELVIPEGIVGIGPQALQQEKVRISIPSTLTTIDETAFQDYYPLELTISSGNKNFVEIDGVIYNPDKTVAIMSLKHQERNIVIPETVTEIYPHAFANVEGKITLPSNLKVVGQGGLSGVTIDAVPQTLEEIGRFAFYNSRITSGVIEIPGTVEEVSGQAFMNVRADKLILQDGVKIVNTQAFSGSGLETVDFGNTIEYIGVKSFENNNISELILPEGLKNIEREAFIGNRILSANIPNSIEYISLDAVPMSNGTMITIDESHPLYNEIAANIGPYLAPSWL